jgi:hypothetical protein
MVGKEGINDKTETKQYFCFEACNKEDEKKANQFSSKTPLFEEKADGPSPPPPPF